MSIIVEFEICAVVAVIYSQVFEIYVVKITIYTLDIPYNGT